VYPSSQLVFSSPEDHPPPTPGYAQATASVEDLLTRAGDLGKIVGDLVNAMTDDEHEDSPDRSDPIPQQPQQQQQQTNGHGQQQRRSSYDRKNPPAPPPKKRSS